MSRPPLALRAYRAALRLYPRAFRLRFGHEMLDFARLDLTDAGRRGPVVYAGTLITLYADLAASVAAQWRVQWRARWRHARGHSAVDTTARSQDMDTLRQDLRFAVRALARRPAFTLIAALTLALGTGANTAIFSLVNAVLIRPLPFPDPGRLVMINGTQNGQVEFGDVYADYVDWRAQSRSFAGLAAVRPQSVNLTGGDAPDRLIGAFVSASYLRVIGARMALGRGFTDRETELATKAPVAVLSYGAWQTRFGGDAGILGRSIVLNGTPFTVIGVTAPGTPGVYGDAPDVMVPVGYYPNAHGLDRGTRGVGVVARLAPGVTIAAAQRELSAIEARLADAYPATNAGTGAELVPLENSIVDPRVRAELLLLLAAVGCVLLIACANVANLQLARGAARGRELSVRAALGAGRGRIARQLLTESLLLAGIGGALGLALAVPLLHWLVSVVGAQLPVDAATIHIDARVLAFAIALAVGTGLLFGLPAALKASRADVGDMLRSRSGGGGAHARTRNALVVAQLALSTALLASAGLLVRSLIALQRVDPGFDASHVLTAQFRLPPTKYDTPAKIAAMFDATIAAIRAVPDVESAALVRASPLSGNGDTYPVTVDGQARDAARAPSAVVNSVTPGYLATMRIPLVAGRALDARDGGGALPVALVSAHTAAVLWPGASPIGKRIRFADHAWTVVGIAGDARQFSIGEAPLLEVYVPVAQWPQVFTSVVVRTRGDPLAAVKAVRAAIWSVDREQPVWRFKPLEQDVRASVTTPATLMWLAMLFAVVALVVAAVGVYGVMSYTMSLRTNEIGLRMALGADAHRVLGMVLREGMRLIAVAIVVGVAVGLAATHYMRSQLYGVSATDALTFGAAVGVLAIVALAACVVPARRASQVDPMIALRAE